MVLGLDGCSPQLMSLIDMVESYEEGLYGQTRGVCAREGSRTISWSATLLPLVLRNPALRLSPSGRRLGQCANAPRCDPTPRRSCLAYICCHVGAIYDGTDCVASWPLKPHVLSSSQQVTAGFGETPCFLLADNRNLLPVCALRVVVPGHPSAAFSTLAHSIARYAAHSKAYRTGSRCQAANNQ